MHRWDVGAMPCYPDMSNQSFIPGLNQRLQRTAVAHRDIPLIRLRQIMHLNQVNVIDAEPFQRLMQLIPGFIKSAMPGFCGQKEVLPARFEKRGQPQF